MDALDRRRDGGDRVDALVMCGGEGSRLGASAPEKPLYPIDADPMIDRVLSALDASTVERIFAAVSPATPETREYLAGGISPIETPVSVIDTPGKGYVTDLSTAVDAFDSPVLTAAADLALLTGRVVDSVLAAYATLDPVGGSMTVAVPATRKDRLGVSVDAVLETDAAAAELLDGRSGDHTIPDRIAPTGLNVVGAPSETDTMYLLDDERIAVNVNRLRDARVAEALL